MQKSLPTAVFISALFAMRMPCDAATPTLTTLYSFPGANGAFPEAGLVLNNGVLYGTTYAGGSGWGTVFSLSPPAQPGGAWRIHRLYAFSGGADGANPRAAVVFSSRGVLFGATEQGGAWGYGTVYSLTPAGGGNWTENVIYNFTGQGGDGAYPEAGLVISPKSGVLFGTTNAGGTGGYGTVFSLTPAAGGAWTEKVLYSFGGAPLACGTASNPACDGANPVATVTLSSNGTVYGTTYAGGSAGWGTVFRLAQQGGVWTETVLYSFNGATSGAGGGTACGTTGQPACDGGAPAGNVVLNTATGVLYGATTLGGNPTGCPLGGYEQGCGVVFQLTPPTPPSTTWIESLLYTFAGPSQDGMLPSYNLASPPSGGPLYGTAFAGGSSSANACFPASYTGCGMVYVLRPPTPPSTTWTKTNLANFYGDNGGGPNGVVLSPTGGLVYGTTYLGGTSGGYGTIFEVSF
jgi:uncharacterized repeat protein (TIGR03803 family)